MSLHRPSVEELASWIDNEVRAGAWLTSFSTGNHKSAIDNNLGPLRNAQEVARQAVHQAPTSPGTPSPYVAQLQAVIQDTYIARGFPHSTSLLGRRVEEMRLRDPLEAAGFLYTKMLNAGSY